MRGIGAILVCLALAAPASAAEYVVGDVWSFKARPHEPTAKVAIAHIELSTPEGEVFFVYLLDVKLQLKGPPGRTVAYGSVAVKRATLDASVVRKVETGTKYPYQSGYATWKDLLEKHGVRAYDKPLAQLLEHLEQTVILTKW
jgi:hypothetical protein